VATTATLTAASEAYTVQAQIAAAAVVAARRLRNPTAVQLAQLIVAYQLLAAQQGAAAVPAVLAQQGLPTAASATVAAQALAGLTSAGYPLSTMFDTITSPAQLAMLVASAVQDAGRNGASVRMAVTPSVTGYVRMLNPPSCSRCVVLAGKFYRWNKGFLRHPHCDCRHIPTTENLAGDLLTDPMEYFESLPTTAELNEQFPNLTRAMRREAGGPYSVEEIFGVDGAQAIRDGADMGRVVNARRKGSVRKAQVFGREAFVTSVGTGRGGRRGPRIMPETIYAIAGDDRAEAIRLLRVHGFIF
jgi:hypothetical protein